MGKVTLVSTHSGNNHLGSQDNHTPWQIANHSWAAALHCNVFSMERTVISSHWNRHLFWVWVSLGGTVSLQNSHVEPVMAATSACDSILEIQSVKRT